MFNNVVYLNREIDTQRRESMESQFLEHNVLATRFLAVETGLQDLIVQPLNQCFGMNPAQISCAISHLEIIRKFGDRDLLVFEDDIDLRPSKFWGTFLEDILSHIPDKFGVAQLFSHPTYEPIMPSLCQGNLFGTGAYYIRPWYSETLINLGYKDGKWDLEAFKRKYPQPVFDKILYYQGPALSLTLFGSKNFGSTILPNATYSESTTTCAKSWEAGTNNIDDVKAALLKLR